MSGYYPYYYLSARDFICLLLTEEVMRPQSYEEKKALEQRTLQDLCVVLFGDWKCFGCNSCRDTRIEGYHLSPMKMKISEYRHCIFLQARTQAIRRLFDELYWRIALLCKTCHETIHHCPTR
jgi:hypothetical protein